MKKVFKQHREYEQYIKSIKLEQPAETLNRDQVEAFINEKPDLLNIYRYAGVLTECLKEAMPKHEVATGSFLFKGHYYNTIINMAKHWGVYSREENIRLVIDNGPVHIELRHKYGNVIEIWNISTAKEIRGQGHGAAIMDLMQTIADEMNMVLSLVPCAQDAGSYDDWAKKTIRLRKWYESLGFEAMDKSAEMVF